MQFEETWAETHQAAPNWFSWAINQPLTSEFTTVNGAKLHYLTWNFAETARLR